MKRILVAGVGNVLRGDDAFGIETARLLMEQDLPENVRVVETGIGGISLVQELMDGYDALLLLDAVDRGMEPGRITFLQLEVKDLKALSAIERRDFLADIHFATPDRALTLAGALDVLPAEIYVLGCQSGAHDTFGLEITPPVQAAIPKAAARAVAWARDMNLQIPPN